MIKKHTLWLLIAFVGFLQSCSINTETTFHNDAATSMLLNVEMKEMMMLANSIKLDSASETKSKSKTDFSKYPKDWKSLYDIQKEEELEPEGKKLTKNPDSIKLLKKIFMKMNFDKEEMTGISMRFDRLTKEEFQNFRKSDLSKDEKLPMPSQNYNNWDGKKLVIDTKQFTAEEITKALERKAEEKKSKNKAIEEPAEEIAEKMKAMLKLFNMKFTNTYKFETKIKSIEGKHDWVKKIDDYTVQINFSTDQFADEKLKLQYHDPQIIIITE